MLAFWIESDGWPFTSVLDSIDTENWAGMLIDMPLAKWAVLPWQKYLIQKGDLRLHPESVKLIMDVLMKRQKFKLPYLRTEITNCAERVDSFIHVSHNLQSILIIFSLASTQTIPLLLLRRFQGSLD